MSEFTRLRAKLRRAKRSGVRHGESVLPTAGSGEKIGVSQQILTDTEPEEEMGVASKYLRFAGCLHSDWGESAPPPDLNLAA